MKKLLCAVLVVVMMLSLVACSKKLSGTYEAEIDIIVMKYTATYEFSGKNVTVTKVVNPLIGDAQTYTIKGTYEIIENADETMDIKFTFETEDDDIKSGTFDFEQGEDYIKIGVVTYQKAE